jgi:hypothetical protein
MASLKDALLKAGLKATVDPKTVAKAQNERPKIAKKQLTETIVHQEQRNFCEECERTLPDVELYHHNNPTTEAEWICVRCADRLKIADNFRKTAQSDTSIKNMLRREYGATRAKTEFATPNFTKPKGPVNGNR